MKQENIYIYGRHAVEEALKSVPKAVRHVLIAGGRSDGALNALLRESGVASAPLKTRDIEQLENADGHVAHQGVVAVIDPSALTVELTPFINALEITPDTALVVLGELEDPHNVGAIIRSAAAFGAAGVLIPQHNQAQVTGTVVKTSAGMAFHVPLVSIGNVNQTLRVLKDKGFWIYGLAMEGANELGKERFDAPAVFVIGSEAEGIREKTLEHCDIRLRIPMHAKTESLNASVSAAIALYAWSAQHPKSTGGA